VLACGVVAVSTGALFSRAAYDAAGAGTLGGGMLLALVRLSLACALTAPAWLRPTRAGPLALPVGTGGRTVAAGLLLGVHFATWLPSLAFTSVAASVTIVTTGPVWIVLLLWLRGERPSARTLAGIGIAIGGGALVAFGDVGGLDQGSNPPLGNALALVAAITFAAHLLLGRDVQNRGLGLWRWTAVVTGVGALAVLPVAALASPGDGPYPAGFWLGAVALALVPQMVGHSSFTWAVRWMSPTLVSVVILLEPVVSTLGAVVLFDEVPGALVAVGGLVLVAGVAVTTVAEQGRAPTPAEDPVAPT
jgi:drug/metabolite transporter (DMT)-like permease